MSKRMNKLPGLKRTSEAIKEKPLVMPQEGGNQAQPILHQDLSGVMPLLRITSRKGSSSFTTHEVTLEASSWNIDDCLTSMDFLMNRYLKYLEDPVTGKVLLEEDLKNDKG